MCHSTLCDLHSPAGDVELIGESSSHLEIWPTNSGDWCSGYAQLTFNQTGHGFDSLVSHQVASSNDGKHSALTREDGDRYPGDLPTFHESQALMVASNRLLPGRTRIVTVATHQYGSVV